MIHAANCACLLAQMTMNVLCVFSDLSLSFSSRPPIPHFLPLFFPLCVFVTGSYSLHQTCLHVSTFQIGNYTYVLLSMRGRLWTMWCNMWPVPGFLFSLILLRVMLLKLSVSCSLCCWVACDCMDRAHFIPLPPGGHLCSVFTVLVVNATMKVYIWDLKQIL